MCSRSALFDANCDKVSLFRETHTHRHTCGAPFNFFSSLALKHLESATGPTQNSSKINYYTSEILLLHKQNTLQRRPLYTFCTFSLIII